MKKFNSLFTFSIQYVKIPTLYPVISSAMHIFIISTINQLQENSILYPFFFKGPLQIL